MNKYGIIGDCYALASVGALSKDGIIDENVIRQEFLKRNGKDLGQFARSYDNVYNYGKINGIAEIANIVTTIFGGIFGGSKQAPCPVCPPVKQKSVLDYALPVVLGFAVGLLLFRKKK